MLEPPSSNQDLLAWSFKSISNQFTQTWASSGGPFLQTLTFKEKIAIWIVVLNLFLNKLIFLMLIACLQLERSLENVDIAPWKILVTT